MQAGQLLTVIMLGLNPEPAGHSALYSSESISGHNSHCGPQAFPTEQQHVDLETGSPISVLHTLRPVDVFSTSR